MGGEIKKGFLKVLSGAAEKFDLPGELVAGAPRMELSGFREFYIENHRGIKEYGELAIVVDTEHGAVRIEGPELSVLTMTKRELLLRGRITALYFDV